MTDRDDEPVAERRAGPLAGVRILSLAEQYPGPYATMILADLGADVVLVERLDGGDPTRRFTGHFEALNRNKRSVALDLKSEHGLQIMQRLAQSADVLIEGFRPGVMEKLGLGADEMRAQFPALVYCSISGFGHSGPMSRRGGHDLTIQGMAGFVTGEGVPTPAPLPVADLSSAMFAAIGVLAALFARRDTGDGARIDVAMVDCLVSWRAVALVSAINGLDPSPYPPNDPGYGVFETASGDFITLSIAGEDHQWRALCEELGLHDMATLTTPDREASKESLQRRLQAAIADVDWAVVAAALEARGVGFGRVNDDLQVANDEQIRARDLIQQVDDGSGISVVRQPILFDRVAGTVPTRAPRLGQHTEEVLAEAGLSKAEIQDLVADGVIRDAAYDTSGS